MFHKWNLELESVNASLSGDSTEVEAWKTPCGLQIIKSRDRTHLGDLLHVSVARKDRLPTWEEMREIRERILPSNIDFMMMFPKEDLRVHFLRYCLHIYQCPSEWNIM